jgi:predicted NAD/FAD-binding protein
LEKHTTDTERGKIAIIGGGAGGISAAYFLSNDYDVDLFESNYKIGGHCDSQVVQYKGADITVDLGAQFFHPDTHPIYVTMLEELGLFDPQDNKADEAVQGQGSICIIPRTGRMPIFSSKYPYLTPLHAADFAIYARAARQVVLGKQSWETTLEEWVEKLAVSLAFKNSLLYPWISAMMGTTVENAKRSSARSILQTFALGFPENPFRGASTYNSKIGLEGNLRRLLDRAPRVTVHVNTPITALGFRDGKWTVQASSGTHGLYTSLVMNTPPRVTKSLLLPLALASDIVPILDKFEYFDAHVLIHTDPTYVHRNRRLWGLYNAMVDRGACEGSIWYGGILKRLPSGETVDIFKSWASERRRRPTNVLHERRFAHRLITPAGIRAARTLGSFQGRNGLFFSGQYTTGMDLQETAVYSAMKVAEALAPASPFLLALRARMEHRGRGNISYDL